MNKQWFLYRWINPQARKQTKPKSILVFPKGTVVKYDGIPCELLDDTPYESGHYRAAMQKTHKS